MKIALSEMMKNQKIINDESERQQQQTKTNGKTEKSRCVVVLLLLAGQLLGCSVTEVGCVQLSVGDDKMSWS